jgi:hypothetical protein
LATIHQRHLIFEMIFLWYLVSHGRIRRMEPQGRASLSDATALKEYGVTSDLLVEGIRAGKLEHREGAIMGKPISPGPEKPA